MKSKIQEMLMGLVAAVYFIAIAFDLIFPVEADLFYADITNEQLVFMHVGPLGLLMLVFLTWEVAEAIWRRCQQCSNRRPDITKRPLA